MNKKSPQDRLADWIASMEHRPVSNAALEKRLRESNFTESELFKDMDEEEKKDLLSDKILLDMYLESMYSHRQKLSMEKRLNVAPRFDSV